MLVISLSGGPAYGFPHTIRSLLGAAARRMPFLDAYLRVSPMIAERVCSSPLALWTRIPRRPFVHGSWAFPFRSRSVSASHEVHFSEVRLEFPGVRYWRVGLAASCRPRRQRNGFRRWALGSAALPSVYASPPSLFLVCFLRLYLDGLWMCAVPDSSALWIYS